MLDLGGDHCHASPGHRAKLEASRLEAAQLADQLTVEVEDAKTRLEALTTSETAMQAQIGELKQALAAEKAASKVIGEALDQARDAAATARAQGIKVRGVSGFECGSALAADARHRSAISDCDVDTKASVA